VQGERGVTWGHLLLGLGQEKGKRTTVDATGFKKGSEKIPISIRNEKQENQEGGGKNGNGIEVGGRPRLTQMGRKNKGELSEKAYRGPVQKARGEGGTDSFKEPIKETIQT